MLMMSSFRHLFLLLWCTYLCGLSQQSLLPPAVPDYVLTATATNITINCESRYSVVFNGTSPGPSLYIKENYTSWVRVYNKIENQNLTVHWHGLSERTSPFSDGTPEVSQWPIASGEYFDYAIATQPGDAGSYFYHSHVEFQAVTATGVLIVEDSEEPPYYYDEDAAFFIQDHYPANDSSIVAGLVATPFVWSGEPQAILINGQSGNASLSNASDKSCAPYVQTTNPGQVYRMRFISNTALSLTTLGIEDHDNLTIIEADGSYTKPWETDHLQLGSGQRFSILFQAKTEDEIRAANKTSYWLRYENRDRPTNVSGYALLQYNVSDSSPPADLPPSPPVQLPQNVTSWAEYALTGLNDTETFPTLAEVTRTVYITMKQISPNGGFINGSFNGSLQWAQDNLVWQTEQRQVNNSVPYLVQVYTTEKTPNYTAAVENGGWDPYSQSFPALVGEVLDIVWLNNAGLSGGWDYHSMHAHGRHYWDLGSGNGTYNATANEVRFANYTPARRDTTILYRYAASGEKEETAGWRAWRIRIDAGSVGAWMMHCHQLGHMIMGMQTVWVYGNTSQILSTFPEQPYVNGYLTFGGDAYGNATYDPYVRSANSTSH